MGEELAFVFGAPLAPAGPFPSHNYTVQEKLLSEAVMAYWTNFAKTGWVVSLVRSELRSAFGQGLRLPYGICGCGRGRLGDGEYGHQHEDSQLCMQMRWLVMAMPMRVLGQQPGWARFAICNARTGKWIEFLLPLLLLFRYNNNKGNYKNSHKQSNNHGINANIISLNVARRGVERRKQREYENHNRKLKSAIVSRHYGMHIAPSSLPSILARRPWDLIIKCSKKRVQQTFRKYSHSKQRLIQG